MKNNMAVPKKLKVEIQYDPEIPILDLYPKGIRIMSKNTCTLMFSQDVEST
jgi:hypothetical protein